jgi:hypothetical protein
MPDTTLADLEVRVSALLSDSTGRIFPINIIDEGLRQALFEYSLRAAIVVTLSGLDSSATTLPKPHESAIVLGSAAIAASSHVLVNLDTLLPTGQVTNRDSLNLWSASHYTQFQQTLDLIFRSSLHQASVSPFSPTGTWDFPDVSVKNVPVVETENFTGYVAGPDASVDGDIPIFEGVDGHLIQDGGLLLSDVLAFLASKAAASGLASLDASSRLAQAVKLILASAAALPAIDGEVQWQSTRKLLLVHDTQRERGISPVGWLPYAFPIGAPTTFTTNLTLSANGGAYACPIEVKSSMLLQSVTVINGDATGVRTWNWYLYEQSLNNGNAGEATLNLVASGAAPETWTATVASNRTIDAAGAPVYLAPGVYWLVIHNEHASNAFSLKTYNSETMALDYGQTKTIAGALGATLDFVLATWTPVVNIAGARLNGRVFGQTVLF